MDESGRAAILPFPPLEDAEAGDDRGCQKDAVDDQRVTEESID
jgi:hypothetical protein